MEPFFFPEKESCIQGSESLGSYWNFDRIQNIVLEKMFKQHVEELEELEMQFTSKSDIQEGDPLQGIFSLKELIEKTLKMNRVASVIRSTIGNNYMEEIHILANQIIEPWIDDFEKKVEQEVEYLKQLLKNEKFADKAACQLKILSIHLEKNQNSAKELLQILNVPRASMSLKKVSRYLENFLKSLSDFKNQIENEVCGIDVKGLNCEYGSGEWKKLVKERPILSERVFAVSREDLCGSKKMQETVSQMKGLFYIYLIFCGQLQTFIKQPAVQHENSYEMRNSFHENPLIEAEQQVEFSSNEITMTSPAPRLEGGLLSLSKHVFKLISWSTALFMNPAEAKTKGRKKLTWAVGEEEAQFLHRLFKHVVANDQMSLEVCSEEICYSNFLEDLLKIRKFKAPKNLEEQDAYHRTLLRLLGAAIAPSANTLQEPSAISTITFIKLILWSSPSEIQDSFIIFLTEKVKNPRIGFSDIITAPQAQYLQDFAIVMTQFYVTNPSYFYQILGDAVMLSFQSSSEKLHQFGRNLINMLLEIELAYPNIEQIAFNCLRTPNKEIKNYGLVLLKRLVDKDYNFSIEFQEKPLLNSQKEELKFGMI